MKIISCASYHGTGSSAITDYVSEFKNVFSLTDEEFRFIQDPDGISDLEYNLVQNHNRHNSGHSIKRYKKLVDLQCGNILKKGYEPYFNGKWKELSYKYIDELTDFTFKGWWQYDLINSGKWFYFRKRIINKLLRLTFWKNQPPLRRYNSMKNEITYCGYPSEEKFLASTKNYIKNLLCAANTENKPIVMVDQLVPPSNLNRYLRYFDDIKVVVVERDPRDLYLLGKYVWRSTLFPIDVEKFCQWYRYTRKHRDYEVYNPEKVMLVQFEDFVYNYDEVVGKLNRFLCLDEQMHIDKMKKFNPENSKKNTKLWLNYLKEKTEIEYIEKMLCDYITNFD